VPVQGWQLSAELKKNPDFINKIKSLSINREMAKSVHQNLSILPFSD
jgi:hypothetical protein